jgi:hypothetical protein
MLKNTTRHSRRAHSIFERKCTLTPISKERQLVEERYASIDFPFEEIPAPDFAIRAEWDASRIAGYCASWSATDCYRKAKNTDPIPSLAKHLTTELGEKTTPIRWPIFLRTGRSKVTENAA